MVTRALHPFSQKACLEPVACHGKKELLEADHDFLFHVGPRIIFLQLQCKLDNEAFLVERDQCGFVGFFGFKLSKRVP